MFITENLEWLKNINKQAVSTTALSLKKKIIGKNLPFNCLILYLCHSVFKFKPGSGLVQVILLEIFSTGALFCLSWVLLVLVPDKSRAVLEFKTLYYIETDLLLLFFFSTFQTVDCSVLLLRFIL